VPSRDRERYAQSVLGGAIRELEVASYEYVKLLLDGKSHTDPEAVTAFEKCQQKNEARRRASKAWQDSLTKGRW
jgi:hypothetical protein